MLMLPSRIKWSSILIILLCVTGVIFIYLFIKGKCNSVNLDSNFSKKEFTDINYPHVEGESVLMEPPSYFDKNFIYKPSGDPKEELSKELQHLTQNAVNIAAKKLETSLSNFSHGSFRLLSGGIEFHIYFDNVSSRVSLFQPLSPTHHIEEITFEEKKVVNIIMPLQGKLEAFSTFLDNLVNKILTEDKYLTLTIVYFDDKNFKEAKSILDTKLAAFPQFKGTMLHLKETQFSRGMGIQAGMEHLGKDPSQLAFFCDVDVLMTPQFFRRCRANSIERYQVFYPIVFSLYNPKIVYKIKEQPVPPLSDQLVVHGDNGFWRIFGYGMACMHKREYDSAGGIPEYKTWGGEDIKLYENIVAQKTIKVIRFPDTTIFHLYHPKNCSGITGTSYPSCLKSKASNEANKLQLGILYTKLSEGIDMEGILSKRFYYFYLVPYLACGIVVCVMIILCLSLSLCYVMKEKSNGR